MVGAHFNPDTEFSMGCLPNYIQVGVITFWFFFFCYHFLFVTIDDERSCQYMYIYICQIL